MVRVRVIMVYDITSTHVQFAHRCTTSDGLSQTAALARNISPFFNFSLKVLRTFLMIRGFLLLRVCYKFLG